MVVCESKGTVWSPSTRDGNPEDLGERSPTRRKGYHPESLALSWRSASNAVDLISDLFCESCQTAPVLAQRRVHLLFGGMAARIGVAHGPVVVERDL